MYLLLSLCQNSEDMEDDTYRNECDVYGLAPQDYIKAEICAEAVKAMSNLTYESVYIIDYKVGKFLYVAPNPLFLCGCTPENVLNQGFAFYRNHVPKDEWPLLEKINTLGFRKVEKIKKDDRMNYVYSYDFHIVSNDHKILIHHKLTPLILDPDGNVWLAACAVSISNNRNAGNIEVRKVGEQSYLRYDFQNDEWRREDGIRLSEGEKQVLYLSAQGLNTDEIAALTNRSKDAIKSRRRAIISKLQVKSMNEAIVFAENYRLI